MKLLHLAALALAPAAAFSTNSEAFNRLFGPNHDAGAVMSQLQGIMGQSQQKLAVAERHHKKTVKKIRKEAEAFLQHESAVYGSYIRNYTADLNKATADLEESVQEAKEGLAKAEAEPSTPNDWKDPNVELRAKLGAQVAAAERTIKKNERRAARSVREAEEHSEETMEDESSKLAMKLGDMSPLVDAAKKSLEAVVDKTVPAVAPVKAAVAAKTDKKGKVDLKALEDKLQQATKKTTAATAEVNKKLDGFLSKTDKDVAAKAAKIQQDLEKAQKTEIEKVLGVKTQAAPVKQTAAPAKKAQKAPVSKKAAPAPVAKKVEAVAAKKVEKVVAKAPAQPAPAAKPAATPAAKVESKPTAAPAKPAAAAAKK